MLSKISETVNHSYFSKFVFHLLTLLFFLLVNFKMSYANMPISSFSKSFLHYIYIPLPMKHSYYSRCGLILYSLSFFYPFFFHNWILIYGFSYHSNWVKCLSTTPSLLLSITFLLQVRKAYHHIINMLNIDFLTSIV